MEGQYADALLYVVPVLAVTCVCCLLAIRWAVSQFNNESVLFRESERWNLQLWFTHLLRDRRRHPFGFDVAAVRRLAVDYPVFCQFLCCRSRCHGGTSASRWSSGRSR